MLSICTINHAACNTGLHSDCSSNTVAADDQSCLAESQHHGKQKGIG
jgi:hypothetical protein